MYIYSYICVLYFTYMLCTILDVHDFVVTLLYLFVYRLMILQLVYTLLLRDRRLLPWRQLPHLLFQVHIL